MPPTLITDDAWWPVVVGAVALGYMVASRFTAEGLPRNSRIAHEAALLLAVTALVLGIGQVEGAARSLPSATTFGLVIAVAVLTPERWRDSRPAWLGWAASAALTVVVVERLGADQGDWPMTLMGWGSFAVLAGLSVERLSAVAARLPVVQRTLPPVALGTIGLGVGAVAVAATADFATTGWWFLLVTATAAVAGLLTRDGRLLGLAAATVTLSYAALAPWDPVERPWTIIAVGAIWLAAADVARRWPSTHAVPRASAALFWVGQLVVVAALPLVAAEDQRPLGLALAGLVSIGIAVRVPVPRVRPLYGAGGAALILLGAADESLGWLTVAWAVLSAGSTAAAAVGRGLSARAILVLRLLGAATGFAAWVTFTSWASWSQETSVIVTAVAAGLLLAALGVTVQLTPAGKPWAEAWGSVALLALMLSTLGLRLPDVPRAPAGQMVSVGLALAAVATALAADPLRRQWLRIATVLLAAAAAVAFLHGVAAEAREVTAVGVALAVAATIGVAVVAGTGRGSDWRPALLVGASLSVSAAVASALTELPDRTLLVGALVVLAAQCVVIGRVVGVTVLLVSGPPLLSLSWVLYASESLSGNPQWYLVPVGLALIVMAALLRWTRRQAHKDMATKDVVALELAGVGFIAGAALVQTVTDSLGYAVLAVAEGVVIALWGAVTKVRRRLAAGVGVRRRCRGAADHRPAPPTPSGMARCCTLGRCCRARSRRDHHRHLHRTRARQGGRLGGVAVRDDERLGVMGVTSVAVVGAGVVGLSTAWFLQEHDVEVTVLERAQVAAGASWGNAGWLMAGDVTPLPSPATLRMGLRGLVSPASAFSVPLRADPGLYRFLLRFARHCTSTHWNRAMQALVPLSLAALEAYDAFSDGGVAAQPTSSRYHLACFADLGSRDAFARHLEDLRGHGVRVEFESMDGATAQAASPVASERVTGAVGLLGQQFVDPTLFVPALAASVVERGGTIETSAEVRSLRDVGRGVDALVMRDARPSVRRFDAVVVCTGAWLSDLVHGFGVRVPVRAGRGYSFNARLAEPLSDTVYLPDQHLACTPMRGRLRMAGSMEFRRPHDRLDPRRILAMVEAARPMLRNVDLDDRTDEWVGPRPVSVDGLPLAGPTRAPRVWCVGGHAMEGMVLGPVTARLAAEGLARGSLPPALLPLDPLR